MMRIVKFVLLSSILLSYRPASASFYYRLSLNEAPFSEVKYNFTIERFVDARLNKFKPVGEFDDRRKNTPRSVGNEFLSDEVSAFLSKRHDLFDPSPTIVVALNQLNLNYPLDPNRRGSNDELVASIALDYYLKEGAGYTQIYRQYYKYALKDLPRNPEMAFTDCFSGALSRALMAFNNTLRSNQLLHNLPIDSVTFFSLLTQRSEQVVTNQTLQDGLYFSLKDIYLNRPLKTPNYKTPVIQDILNGPITIASDVIPIPSAFSIVIDHRIFIYTGHNIYTEAFIDDKGTLFFRHHTVYQKQNSGIGRVIAVEAAGIVFGFFGALLADVVSSSVEKPATTEVEIESAIDYETGALMPHTTQPRAPTPSQVASPAHENAPDDDYYSKPK